MRNPPTKETNKSKSLSSRRFTKYDALSKWFQSFDSKEAWGTA
jgi:hypothetical protein